MPFLAFVVPVTAIVGLQIARVAACGAADVSVWSLDSFTELARWGDEPVHDLAWLDDDTLAFATDSGLVLARLA